MKLKRTAFKHIEAEIYSYSDTLKGIQELRQDIIFAGRQGDDLGLGMVSGGYIESSTTERRATKLADSILLREMERITKAIEEAYLVQKDDTKRILWVKYGLVIMWPVPEGLKESMAGKNRFDMTVDEMAQILEIDDNTFARYKKGFVYGVAERLGWY